MKTSTLHESLKRTERVLLIYTGGTIGMGHNSKTGALEPLDFNHLLSRIPELDQIQAKITVYQFDKPIDSSDMDYLVWSELVQIISQNYNRYDGFVILHGTDTMAYTASALSFMLQNLTKPVILTGSQLPIGQLRTDGKENLLTSIELASLTNEHGVTPIPEVCIYFSGRLLRGNRSTKQDQSQQCGFYGSGTWQDDRALKQWLCGQLPILLSRQKGDLQLVVLSVPGETEERRLAY